MSSIPETTGWRFKSRADGHTPRPALAPSPQPRPTPMLRRYRQTHRSTRSKLDAEESKFNADGQDSTRGGAFEATRNLSPKLEPQLGQHVNVHLIQLIRAMNTVRTRALRSITAHDGPQVATTPGHSTAQLPAPQQLSTDYGPGRVAASRDDD